MGRGMTRDARVLDHKTATTGAALLTTRVAELRRPRRIAPERVSVTKQAPSGLCATCVQAADCSYRARNDEAVWYCEEFMDSAAAPASASAELTVAGRGAVGADDTEVVELERGAGLCVNCRHNKTCLLPRNAGGVWHCEEYECG